MITPAEHVASDIVEKTTESEVISEPVADVPVEATHVSDIAVPGIFPHTFHCAIRMSGENVLPESRHV